jgi:aldose 1-epimerase
MFSIIHEDFFGVEKIKLVNSITGEYVSVIPLFGGNLNELILLKHGVLYTIIDGDKTLDSLKGNTTNFYRGAKLSPFPNRINKGRYQFNEAIYELERNDGLHALHGLLWNRPLFIKDQRPSENSAQLLLSADIESLHEGFPFNYRIEIEYFLDAKQFSCSTKIINTSAVDLPIGDGWHPYFTTGTNINQLKLKLPQSRLLQMDNGIPTGVYLPNDLYQTPSPIQHTDLDHCFEISAADIVETHIMDEEKDITIVLWQRAGNKGYQFIQIYTPPDRNSIAIEPMTCAPDAFNNKKGLIVLFPDEQIVFDFGLKLE